MLIGLTGGIASGKSTVSQMITELSIPVIDADQVAREVVEPGTSALQAIRNHFGDKVLNEDGTLARKQLGAIIFKNPEERKVLNQIVHPAVRNRMEELKQFHLKNGEKTIVYDIPLLFESDLFYLVEKVILVYVDEDTQVQRLMNRDQAGIEDAKQRIGSQMPLAHKRDRADFIIDNSQTTEQTKEQLLFILKEWSIL
ncbi:dephospho-CoA kinase [Halalkalibacter akibai]|uniref:Dephospho-CoA kinase n=1 Tax=Halalkalibacter akibai (strain ATCC 43226 / DSM 21942 / CIP 109018 / JCM 9157 / 1139) TaxID=1236973 RepID=W4QPV3_HALA3|nr:dephospho-CoA kinase [Halalkalibacter akibai]GAE34101.1 dephospho-CoA kinase [Halalkalibacter akibai JCM 9157]